MRRSRRPTPLILSDLRYDPEKQLYSRTQEGITYSMPLELTRHLKEYYRDYDGKLDGGHAYPSMDRWYRDLSKQQKQQVIRTGNVPVPKSDFFPDPEYD